MFKVLLSFLLFVPCLTYAIEKADFVLVDKTDARLYLLKQGKVIKAYPVSFGRNPVGHKEKQGDGRTPEGEYRLDFKKSDSAFYKAIRISYPNQDDLKRARKKQVDPGGQIMIHGEKIGREWLTPMLKGVNWTNGCIAVTNSEMDEIWEAIEIGTGIKIQM